MLLAPALGAPPREIAERLGRAAERAAGGRASTASRSPGPASSTSSWPTPGTSNAARGVVGRRRRLGPRHARARRSKVNVEYVSANPTGPLTAASGRHAAYGDALARMLELAGHEVTPRVLLQQRGLADRPARRVRARPRPPRAGARGRLPGRLRGRPRARRSRTPPSGDAERRWAPQAAALIMEGIRATLHAYRVEFDTLLPRGLAARGRPVADRDRASTRLREQGHLYESEGALWLRTTRRSATTRTACCARSTRRADVLRRRRRLPGGQVPARLRHGDLRPRRRPSRLHRAAEGDRWRRSARTRTASRCRSCSSCTSSRAARRRRCPSAAATS